MKSRPGELYSADRPALGVPVAAGVKVEAISQNSVGTPHDNVGHPGGDGKSATRALVTLECLPGTDRLNVPVDTPSHLSPPPAGQKVVQVGRLCPLAAVAGSAGVSFGTVVSWHSGQVLT